MIISEPYIPAILAGAGLIIWTICNKPKSFINLCGRVLFLSASLFLFTAFFLPLPLNSRGFYAISDSLIPLNEAVRLIPFISVIESSNHLDYYLSSILPMLMAAGLLGLSVNFAFKRKLSIKGNLLLAFLVPLGAFLAHAVVRLTTGAMLKQADVTNIIWFMLAYLIGYLFYLLCKHFAGMLFAKGFRNEDS